VYRTHRGVDSHRKYRSRPAALEHRTQSLAGVLRRTSGAWSAEPQRRTLQPDSSDKAQEGTHNRSAPRCLIRGHRDPAGPCVSLGRQRWLPEPSLQSLAQRRPGDAGNGHDRHRLHLLGRLHRQQGMRPQLGAGGRRRSGHVAHERQRDQLRHGGHIRAFRAAAAWNVRLFVYRHHRGENDRPHFREPAIGHRDGARHSPAHSQADACADAEADTGADARGNARGNAGSNGSGNRRTDGGPNPSLNRGGSGCRLPDLWAACPVSRGRRHGSALGWPGRKPGARTGTRRLRQ
jgi:hypothetical protein